MATVQTQQIREERWRETTKDDGSTTRMNKLEIKEEEYMRFKTTQSRSTTTMNIRTHKAERQVLMQYMKAAHRWSIS
jgi:hypothetical protein